MTFQLSLLRYPLTVREARRPDELVVVDLFAGGGGASLGIFRATGVHPIVAVNHDPHAIEMHAENHPDTLHLCENVFAVEPAQLMRGRRVNLLWASPDCTHFSRAKGGKPKKKEIRALAWVVATWAEQVRPEVICLENVSEFQDWGPLYPEDHPDEKLRNQPIPDRRGETFVAFVGRLRELGYQVDWRVLNAADFGAPTSRKRLFLVARCDGRPVAWPTPTHGPGRARPWRSAGEIIDWSVPALSIFASKAEAKAWAAATGEGIPRRPLAEATQRRIAEGLRRYVLEASDPYVVSLPAGERVVGSLVQTGYGERKGQRPRALDIRAPLGTVVATGAKHAVVTAWLAKYYTGVVGQSLEQPSGTITARDHHALVAASLTKFYGTSKGSSLGSPTPTVTASGNHLGLVAAFLLKYYGAGGQWQALDEPLHTIVAKARFGLVTVDVGGEPHVIADIGMRMLQPHELARAQGFGDDYVLTGTKEQQIARIGNSVCPDVAEALVRAQLKHRVAA